RGALRERLKPTPRRGPSAAPTTLIKATKIGQCCRATLRHCRNRVPQGCSRELMEFRGCCGIPLSCCMKRSLLPLRIPRSSPAPTPGLGRCLTRPPSPRVEGPVGVEKGAHDVDHERPQVDRLVVHPAVVV